MGDKSKIDANKNADKAPGPGDPDWDRNRQVIHGEADEQVLHQGDVDKGADGVERDRK